VEITVPELRIERQSLAYEVARRLSRLIEEGHLPPGTRLVEIDLSRQMGVSRGPLREALRILETMALVENIPGRGSYVAALSREDAIELYAVRLILEVEAARQAAHHPVAEDIEILRDLYASLVSANQGREYSQLEGEDILFHQKIWAMSGNKRLKQMLDSMINQIRRYHSLQTHLYQTPMVGVDEHGDILEAIEQKMPDEAAAAMRRHMLTAAQVAIKSLPETFAENPV
jgi:DNA-binding GntR family transcriptional regulator